MKTFYNLNISKKFKNSVIAIGNFDGVHLGHQKTLTDAKKQAKKDKINLGVLTFEPIPIMFFKKKITNHRLNSLEQKKEFLKKQKVDFMIIKKFDKKFSNINYLSFIKDVIFKKIRCRYIFVSKNFKFGKNRKGDVNELKFFEKEFKFKTVITKIFKKDKKIISSTKIRKLISAGNIEKANKLLGRNWSIRSKVIKGFQRGRKIGFPTCNFKLANYIIPKCGVYSVRVKGKSFFKKGIANVGYRPTFKGKNLLLEVNIFGINQNLYNKVLNIDFIKFIRSEKKFKNLEDLKKQINTDITKV
tara:strand:+ start:233 stop:1135 length:903 start_codon:yes stop_codon:yes gene_type:complete